MSANENYTPRPKALVMSLQELKDRSDAGEWDINEDGRKPLVELINENGGVLFLTSRQINAEGVTFIQEIVSDLLAEMKEQGKFSFWVEGDFPVLVTQDLIISIKQRIEDTVAGKYGSDVLDRMIGQIFGASIKGDDYGGNRENDNLHGGGSKSRKEFDINLVDPALRNLRQPDPQDNREDSALGTGGGSLQPMNEAGMGLDNILRSVFKDLYRVTGRAHQRDNPKDVFPSSECDSKCTSCPSSQTFPDSPDSREPTPSGAVCHPEYPPYTPEMHTSEGNEVSAVESEVRSEVEKMDEVTDSQIAEVSHPAQEVQADAENWDIQQAAEDIFYRRGRNVGAGLTATAGSNTNPPKGMHVTYLGDFATPGPQRYIQQYDPEIRYIQQHAPEVQMNDFVSSPQQPQVPKQRRKRQHEEVDDVETVEELLEAKITVLGRCQRASGRGYRFQFLVDVAEEATDSQDDLVLDIEESAHWVWENNFLKAHGKQADSIIALFESQYPREVHPNIEEVIFTAPPAIIKPKAKRQRKATEEVTSNLPVQGQSAGTSFSLANSTQKGDILAITGRRTKKQGPGLRYLYCLSLAATTDNPAMEVWEGHPDVIKMYGPIAATLMARFDAQFDRKAQPEVFGQNFTAPLPIPAISSGAHGSTNTTDEKSARLTPINLKTATIVSFLARRNKRQGSGWRWLLLAELGGDHAGHSEWVAEKELLNGKRRWAVDVIARFDAAYPKNAQQEEYLYLDQPFRV